LEQLTEQLTENDPKRYIKCVAFVYKIITLFYIYIYREGVIPTLRYIYE